MANQGHAEIPLRPDLRWASDDDHKRFVAELHACGSAMRELLASGAWRHVPAAEWMAPVEEVRPAEEGREISLDQMLTDMNDRMMARMLEP